MPPAAEPGATVPPVPATGPERILVIIGLAAAGVLAFFTVIAWRDYRDSAPTATVRATTPPPPPVVATTTVTEPVVTPPAPAIPPASTLVLRATRGDSWVAVRADSDSGARLFEGILAQGEQRRFRRERLWVRFGLPENVDATLNGERVELPTGVATVVVRGGRLTTVESG